MTVCAESCPEGTGKQSRQGFRMFNDVEGHILTEPAGDLTVEFTFHEISYQQQVFFTDRGIIFRGSGTFHIAFYCRVTGKQKMPFETLPVSGVPYVK